jgi:alpha-beta hydrolase superfamily lysophospholipase
MRYAGSYGFALLLSLVLGFWSVTGARAQTVNAESFEIKQASGMTQGYSYCEQEVLVGNSAAPLRGILTLPQTDEPCPCVVLMHGLGAYDKDCTVGPNKPFMQIAHGLAAQGIAVLRYDKRTFAYPACAMQPNFDINQELLEDATSAIELAGKNARIDSSKVYICGHSMGGLLTAELVQRMPELAGIVILSSPGKTLNSIYEAMNSMQQAAVKAAFAPRCWQQVKDIDAPQQTIESNKPVFVAQGGTDQMVPPVNGFNAWQNSAAAQSNNIALSFYPGMNHALLELPSEGHTLVQPALVPAQLIQDLCKWIAEKSDASRVIASQ